MKRLNILIGSTYFLKITLILLPKEKSSKIKDIQIPYSDFTVNDSPVFKKDACTQISFNDILRESMLNCFPLTPVKRRSPDSFTFHGVFPFCGASEEYIYDNNSKGQFKCKVYFILLSLCCIPSTKAIYRYTCITYKRKIVN